MTHHALPPSDLTRLAEEILKQPSDAALPRNLSDAWLTLVARDLAGAFDEADHVASVGELIAVPLALVLHVLAGQTQGEALNISNEKVMRCLNDYRIEVALELVNRQTEAKTSQATLATIFKSREVGTTVA